MELDLSRMLRQLAPAKPYRDALDRPALGALSHALRREPELWRPFYHTLRQRAAHDSCQVRFLCFQLTHYLFCRSAHFRGEVCRSYFLDFLSAFLPPLPPPAHFAARLASVAGHVVRHWAERFGAVYPPLRLCVAELRGARGAADAAADARRESVAELAELAARRNRPLLDEMHRLLALCDAGGDAEYREVLAGALRERRRGIRECIGDFDRLRVSATGFALPPPLAARIDALAGEAAAVEAAAIRCGLEDDEFVDAGDG
jgi:hypothetical protein